MAEAQHRTARRGYEYFDALDPGGSEPVRVGISPQRQGSTAKRGKGPIREMAETVPACLKCPERIYEGIRRDDDEDRGDCDGWRCYVFRPDHAWKNGRNPGDPPVRMDEGWPDEVFLVFVNDECVAYTWRWEGCDPDDVTRPEGWRDRFGKEVYP